MPTINPTNMGTTTTVIPFDQAFSDDFKIGLAVGIAAIVGALLIALAFFVKHYNDDDENDHEGKKAAGVSNDNEPANAV